MSPTAARSRGFTLIELITVVAVLVVLGVIAAPSFIDLVAAQRVRNASFDLVSDLLLARSEALKRQADVVVTPLSTNDDGWSGGWTITAPDGSVLSRRSGLPPAVRFAPADSGGNELDELTFGGANGGRLTLAATPVQINVKSDNVPTAKWTCVRLDATGRARADKGGCS